MSKKQIFTFLFTFIPALVLADLAAPRVSGSLAYEALNLVDGKRTVAEIRHWLLAGCRAQCRASSGWFEPGDVAAYLAALERIGMVVHENSD